MVLSRVILAFAAGFISVLIFHQGMFTLLHAINLTPRSPFPTTPTQPLGISQIWSLAFWGGIWGIGFGAIAPRFPQDNRYWVSETIFRIEPMGFAHKRCDENLSSLLAISHFQARGKAAAIIQPKKSVLPKA